METAPDLRGVHAVRLGRNGASPEAAVGSMESVDRWAGPTRRRRRSPVLLASLAAASGVGALVLAGAALVIAETRETTTGASLEERAALSLVAKPSTVEMPFRGSAGRLTLAIGSGGRAVILSRGLEPAPEGQIYHAWALAPGASPMHLAAFTGVERVVFLSAPVETGTTVGITLGGPEAAPPTVAPAITAERT